jgi:outer membrane protein
MNSRWQGRVCHKSGPAAFAAAVLIASMTAGCMKHDASYEAAATQALASSEKPAPAAKAPTGSRLAPASTAAAPATPASLASTQVAGKPASGPAGFIDPLTKSGERVSLTLEQCLRRTLANNLGLQIARFGPPIAHTTVIEAEALFDPTWFLNSAAGRVREPSPNSFLGTSALIENTWTFTTGIQDHLVTGANVQLSQSWTWLRANSPFIATPSPQYSPGLTLSVTQPLLRGAGVEVNTSPIVLARLDETISAEDFKLVLQNTILQVEAAYWDLVVAETQVQAISEALEAARENLRITTRRFEEGKDKRVVVSLATSAVTSREADLVAARLHLATASDLLKRLMHDPELPLAQPVVLLAMEPPLADPTPVGSPLLEKSLSVALQNRPELHQADARLSQADLRERVAKNATLPQLDFVASYGLTGLDKKLGPAMEQQFSTEFYNWSAGLNFSFPIGNRGPTAAYHRSQLLQSQTVRTREDILQQVMLDVSQSVRNLAAAQESILASRAAREAAEQTVKDEEAFVSAGAALLKDLLDAQGTLADAKVREMQAMSAYMVGLAALQRAQGTLLDYNNIRLLDETSARAPAASKK